MIEPLKRAKEALTCPSYNYIPHDWRYALVGVLLEYERLVRRQLNSWFLCECRREQKIPFFIEKLPQRYLINVQHQTHYQKVSLKFKRKVLNMVIKDSFSKVAIAENTYKEKLNWFQNQQADDKIQRQRKNKALDFITLFEGQIHAVLERDKKDNQKKKIGKLVSYRPMSQRLTRTEGENRVTVLGDVKDLHPRTLQVLSKGPNHIYPITSGTRLKEKECEAEVGLERHFYGKKWGDRIEESRGSNSRQDFKFSLRNPETHKSQPPPSHPAEEERMKSVKAQVLASYSKLTQDSAKHKPISQEDIDVLRQLTKRNDLIIKQSDKDKQFVIATKEMYIEKVNEMLADEETYENVPKNPLRSMVNEVEALCTSLSVKYPDLAEAAKPYHPRLPEFYCLWKTHKGKHPPPLRPVTSQVDSPTERLGTIVNYILQQGLQYVPTHLKDTNQFTSMLDKNYRQDTLIASHTMITADVKSLYTNVPIEHGVTVVAEFIRKNFNDIDSLSLEFGDFKTILKSVVEAGFFRFNDKYYRQKDGLGMGIKPAPPFAIIYVYCTVEKPLLEKDFEYAINKPICPDNIPSVENWVRYVDDCWMTAETENTSRVESLFEYINLINPHIQFTYESSQEKIDFLDLTVNIENGNLEYELFIKPTSKGIFLNEQSAHPKSTKEGTAINEIKRALKNGSTKFFEDRGVEKIRQMLLNNQYTTYQVERMIKKAKQQLQNTTELKKKENVLCLPFTNDSHKRQVLNILKRNGVLENTRVCFKGDKKLKDILSRTPLLPTPCNKRNDTTCYECDRDCMTKNVVYKLTCNMCQEIYVGETGRFKRTRCWEHYKAVANETTATAMGKHYVVHHKGAVRPTSPFKFEIIRKCRDFVDRMLWQSLYIKKLFPRINTQLVDKDAWTKYTWALY